MKPEPMPKYIELDRMLSDTPLKLHPSQAHGLICGMLCSPSQTAQWEKLIMGDQEKDNKAPVLLQKLYETSAQQLEEFEFDFQLLLPADSKDLPTRAEALTLWCQGFLTGLQKANIQIAEREPSESTEAINDLIEISKMNYEDVVASEEDEEAYTELVEYVRMAIILVYQECHEVMKTTSQSDLH